MRGMSRKVGKYEVGETIGEGTFAKVKKATNTETGDRVAVKILAKSTILEHNMVDQVIFNCFLNFIQNRFDLFYIIICEVFMCMCACFVVTVFGLNKNSFFVDYRIVDVSKFLA